MTVQVERPSGVLRQHRTLLTPTSRSPSFWSIGSISPPTFSQEMQKLILKGTPCARRAAEVRCEAALGVSPESHQTSVFDRSSTAHPPVNAIVPLLVMKPATGTGRIPSGSQAASTCVAVGIGSESAYAHDLSLASFPSSLFGAPSSVQTQPLDTA